MNKCLEGLLLSIVALTTGCATLTKGTSQTVTVDTDPSGAMHRYPDRVAITLIPEAFATVQARDEFFDRMRATLDREAAEVKDRIDWACGRGNCDRELAAADAGKAEKLAEIEQRRAAATIARSEGQSR